MRRAPHDSGSRQARAPTRSPRPSRPAGADERGVQRRLRGERIGLGADETVTCTFTEHEAVARSSSRSRRTPTVPRRSSASTRATTRTASRSPTVSRTTPARLRPARTRSPRTCRRAGISSRPSAATARPANAIALAAGETVTCVFTNEKDAVIVVEKQTSPDGSPQLFTFTRSYGANFQLSDGQQHNSGDLNPGQYSVSENVPAGWALTSAVCSDGSRRPARSTSHAGETVTCVFTNTVKPGKIVVDQADEPGRGHAGLRLHGELRRETGSRSPTASRTTPARSLPASTRSRRRCPPAGISPRRSAATARPASAVVVRPRRDGHLRLNEREGLEHRRREADEAGRRHAGLHVHRELRR